MKVLAAELSQSVSPWTTKDGTPVTIRPIRSEDEPLLARFHQSLSERSVYMRYFSRTPLAQPPRSQSTGAHSIRVGIQT
jgi:hypothetical protein